VNHQCLALPFFFIKKGIKMLDVVVHFGEVETGRL
jgi:hypothetical protein